MTINSFQVLYLPYILKLSITKRDAVPTVTFYPNLQSNRQSQK